MLLTWRRNQMVNRMWKVDFGLYMYFALCKTLVFIGKVLLISYELRLF